MCGAIAQYNATEPPAGAAQPGAGRSASGSPCAASSSATTATCGDQFVDEMAGWLRDGQISVDETVVDGLENAPDAFLGMLRGENLGKMLVRV